MSVVRLTKFNGKHAYVDPRHVHTVTAQDQGTYIYSRGDPSPLRVTESAAEVVRLLGKADGHWCEVISE